MNEKNVQTPVEEVDKIPAFLDRRNLKEGEEVRVRQTEEEVGGTPQE